MSTSNKFGNGNGAGGGGKITDPVFVFMVVAVVLAVGSSFALRAVVKGLGPSSAHASDVSANEELAGDGMVLAGGGAVGDTLPSTLPSTQPAADASKQR